MSLLISILCLCAPLIVLSWVLPSKWQLLPLGVATAAFMGYYAPVSLAVLLGTAIISYVCLQKMASLTTAMLVVVIHISGIFLFFKLPIASHFGLTPEGVIPLGLSYYSFRQIHYAIEAYKKQLPSHSLWDYLSYLFFLPTLLVGPINQFQPFLKDVQRRRPDQKLFAQGLERILYGFVKVIVIGNFIFSHKLDRVANRIATENEWLGAYLQMCKFAGNAFVQFAGYSDIAIGLSLLFGFRIMENFNWPFTATNIFEFWNRWHISLSEWCRNYVFYPFLGMTRSARISILMSMLVLGAWHEISWRYLLWGAMHAIAISCWHQYKTTRFFQFLCRYPLLQKTLGIGITAHFVVLSFVMIKEESLEASIRVYQTLFFIS